MIRFSRTSKFAFLVALTFGSAVAFGQQSGAEPRDAVNDPFLWLESKVDPTSKKLTDTPEAIAYVARENAKVKSTFEAHADYESTFSKIALLKKATDRLPAPFYIGENVYDVWKDEKNPRGIFRRTTISDYKNATPNWEIVLDIDALSKAEKAEWTWGSIQCLRPEYRKCLMELSPSGKDAVVVREFDLEKKGFVKDGFNVPEAKTEITWIDENRVFIGTTLFPNSTTESSYTNQIRIWKRGMPMASSKLVRIIPNTEMVAYSTMYHSREGKNGALLIENPDFFTRRYFDYDLLTGKSTRIPVEAKADVQGYLLGRYFFRLNQDWSIGTKNFKSGSLVAVHPDNPAGAELVWEPSATTALSSVIITDRKVRVIVLDNVISKVFDLIREKDGARWTAAEVPLPKNGTLRLRTRHAENDSLIVTFENYLTPTTQFEVSADSTGKNTIQKIKALPPRFDASNFTIDALSATSKDGTKIPYFVVRGKEAPRNGQNPTVLYGYGGFKISLTPSYSGAIGKAWLEKGGVYVVANIRGGGEFGPAWHQAALRENRQRAFDDFIAVAESLISSGITSPSKLGIWGGSNGGLLVGATLTQRPDLMSAVVCEVPLLDMIRMPFIGAGASWIGEYGDGRVPADAAFILKYSPYQNVVADKKYPSAFFTTSASDDRVGTAHARKMSAKMLDQGHSNIFFYESNEGGHSGGGDLNAEIRNETYKWVYLYRTLFGAGR